MWGLAALTGLVVSLGVGIGLAAAQSPSGRDEAVSKPPAQACMQDLRAFARSMNQDGYWLSGWQPGRADSASARAGRWGALGWQRSPQGQLRILYSAAHVLAELGDEQTCQAVLGKARDLYASSVTDLGKHGVQIGILREYRREQIKGAVAISSISLSYRLAALTGTDVRNGEDKYLGSVEDLMIDPRVGQPCYVLIGIGGFLGIGEEYAAVPWRNFKATSEMATLILDVDQTTLDKAPKLDPIRLRGRETTDAERKADAYWRQHPGKG